MGGRRGLLGVLGARQAGAPVSSCVGAVGGVSTKGSLSSTSVGFGLEEVPR